MTLDWKAFDNHMTEACDYYEKTAPSVCDFVDDVYRRINANSDTVTLSEIHAVCLLRDQDGWEQPNYAANRIYKLMNRLGRDTTGLAGF